MIARLRIAIWFLRHPRFWPQATHLLRRKLAGHHTNQGDRESATQWAAEKAVGVEQALGDLGIYDPGTGPIPEIAEDDLADAEARAKHSPVRMGGRGDLKLLYAAVLSAPSRRVIETGVAYGWSSLAILLAQERRGEGRLASVDMPYPGLGNEPFVGIVVPESLRDRWVLFRESDRSGLPKAIRHFDGVIDLCHYDSDKSYDGRMFGYHALWQALRPGGIFISDDIHDNDAFRDFCASRQVEFRVTHSGNKYAGIIVKPTG